MLHTNEGPTSPVYLRKTDQYARGAPKLTVEFSSRKLMTTTCDHLRAPSQPDIAQVLVSLEDFDKYCNDLLGAQ